MHRNQRNEAGKLFIGGLSWDTNQDSLLNYFSQFGEVVDCVVMKNPQTGKSRGFGFVTFKDPQCVGTVLSVPAHTLDGRQVDAKACNPKGLNKGQRMGGEGGRGGGGGGGGRDNDPYKDFKIFMGGLPNVDEEFLQNFFGRYGKVIDVNIMKDPSNKKSRGFGFLTFESEDSVEQVCEEHYININGKKVECKRATPRDGRNQRDQPPPFMHQQNSHMGRGPPPEMMGGPPPQQEWNQGHGNWNQGPPPPPQMEGGPPPGPPPNNFPPGHGYQPPPMYQQAPQSQPPAQPPFSQPYTQQPGYQAPPAYQQAEVPGYNYSQQPPQTAYGQQPPANQYGQYAQAAAPQPAAVPAQSPPQPPYSAYGQQPPTAASANPAYATPGLPVADPAAQPPPAANPAAYSAYAYSAQAPAVPTAVPDPYAQTAAQPAAQPGYGGVTPATAAAPTDPATGQPKPADYSAYGYGTYAGYGDGASGLPGVPQPAPAYPGQGDAQLPGAYQAQPGGGYQRAAAPSAQPYHPYRR